MLFSLKINNMIEKYKFDIKYNIILILKYVYDLPAAFNTSLSAFNSLDAKLNALPCF